MADTDQVKQQILEQADIADVISQYVQLQNRGGRLFGLCPFHKEKTPSFTVNPDRGFYHCFGCGKGGNVIDFVMSIETLTYPEAKRHLASKLGIQIEAHTGPQRPHQDIDRYQVMDQATQFYIKRLHNNRSVMGYLKSRELTLEDIKQFALGYSPDAWDGLRSEMQRRNIPEKVLEELGLIIHNKNKNSYYDRFRNRVMFPIRNTLGRVIAFGGRSLDPNEQAKYLNSNDTSLFNKSKVLYLLDKAKDVLKERGVVLVEGYMDAIAMHAQGFQQTVASLGTALTAEHIHILRRYTNDFTLLYDGDPAGVKAAMRGVELFFENGHTVRAALLPDKMDPDDFIKKHGKEAMQEFLKKADDGFNFYTQQLAKNHDPKTTQGKLDLVDAVTPLLAKIKDSIFRNDCMLKMSTIINQDAEAIKATINQKLKQGKFRTYPTQTQAPSQELQQKKVDPLAFIKNYLIRLLAFHHGFILPEGIYETHNIVLFNAQKLEELSSLIQIINENSIHDIIIKRLLTAQQTITGGNHAARIAELFPDNREQSAFIAITEVNDLPGNEEELRQMLDQLIEIIQNRKDKLKEREIRQKANDDPKKALQELNDLLLGGKKST